MRPCACSRKPASTMHRVTTSADPDHCARFCRRHRSPCASRAARRVRKIHPRGPFPAVKTLARGSRDARDPPQRQPTAAVPADVKIGRRVTLFTEPGKDGATQLVSRVTTTSVTPEGNVKSTTEDTRTLPSGVTTKTTTTTLTGTGAAYEAGKTLTVTKSDGSKVTYVINEKSTV